MSDWKILSYRIIRQAWQNPCSGCDTVEVHYEDGTIDEETHHPATHWWNDGRFKDAKVLPATVSGV